MTAADPRDFHPDLRLWARILPSEIVSPATLPMIRRMTRILKWRGHPEVREETIDADVSVRLYQPPGLVVPAPALLWIHGGGYVTGSAYQDEGLCRRFSAALGITVASVEYRLAPEHPYPLPLEDCYAALRWLVDRPEVDATRVAIGGASAGGGLAAALALIARDRGEVTPALQLLVYPMLDDRTTAAGDHGDNSTYRVWGNRSNRFGWSAYLRGADPGHAVPARREDLTGLPPAWIGVGTRDLFHDEDLVYARRLTDAGVPCQTEVVPGGFHGFDVVAPGNPVSKAFFAGQCAALRRTLLAPH